jgi:hypothetical protein
MGTRMQSNATSGGQPVLTELSQHASSGPDDAPMPADVAEYIADVLAELREMAHSSGQVPLSLLLDVARREAITPINEPTRGVR